MDHTRQHT